MILELKLKLLSYYVIYSIIIWCIWSIMYYVHTDVWFCFRKEAAMRTGLLWFIHILWQWIRYCCLYTDWIASQLRAQIW